MKTINAVAIVALIAFQGCAFTKAQLKVSGSPDAHISGPMGEVAQTQFKLPQLDDARPDKARIGWKKNGFGQNTADITTEQPVDKIVEGAISKAIVDNHHTVGDNGRFEVVGTVDRFWFDADVNFWTVKFIGDVQCSLEFVDSQTKRSVYKKKYSGNYAEEKGGGLEKTWTTVMNKAVDKLIESIVLDDELASALRTANNQK